MRVMVLSKDDLGAKQLREAILDEMYYVDDVDVLDEEIDAEDQLSKTIYDIIIIKPAVRRNMNPEDMRKRYREETVGFVGSTMSAIPKHIEHIVVIWNWNREKELNINMLPENYFSVGTDSLTTFLDSVRTILGFTLRKEIVDLNEEIVQRGGHAQSSSEPLPDGEADGRTSRDPD
jgi:hypothetical protein